MFWPLWWALEGWKLQADSRFASLPLEEPGLSALKGRLHQKALAMKAWRVVFNLWSPHKAGRRLQHCSPISMCMLRHSDPTRPCPTPTYKYFLKGRKRGYIFPLLYQPLWKVLTSLQVAACRATCRGASTGLHLLRKQPRSQAKGKRHSLTDPLSSSLSLGHPQASKNP